MIRTYLTIISSNCIGFLSAAKHVVLVTIGTAITPRTYVLFARNISRFVSRNNYEIGSGYLLFSFLNATRVFAQNSACPETQVQVDDKGTVTTLNLPPPGCILDTTGGKLIDAHKDKALSSNAPFVDLIASILDSALLIAGGLAVIALIYSGIMYFTAYGDEAKAKLAKRNSTWAIIGIVIIVLSYTLVAFISQASFLGF